MSTDTPDFDWPDIERAHGLEYSASDEEILEAMEEAAEETGLDLEEVHAKILNVLGLDEEEEMQGSSLPEGLAGPAAADNPEAASDPRLEALDLYLVRQQI